MICDEITKQPVENPNLSAGYVYDGFRIVGYTDGGYKVMQDTVTEKRPRGLRTWVPPEPITEPCQYYHKYTEDELAAMQPTEEPSADTEARLAALEDELAAAKILLGVE